MAAYGGRGGQRPGGQRPGGQRPDGSDERSGERPDGNGFGSQLSTKLCANQSLADAFLAQMQELINTLQTNGSFTQVLADRAQEIAYIQSATNTALLSSNCTAYFTGLTTAINADRAVVKTREQYFRAAADATKQIIVNLIGRGRY